MSDQEPKQRAVRMTDDEWAMVKAAAKEAEVSMNDFVREKLQAESAASETEISQQNMVDLRRIAAIKGWSVDDVMTKILENVFENNPKVRRKA